MMMVHGRSSSLFLLLVNLLLLEVVVRRVGGFSIATRASPSSSSLGITNSFTSTSLAAASSDNDHPNRISASSIYFDITVAGEDVGRLIFDLPNPHPLPKHAENVIQLCLRSRRSIDPAAHYEKCEFDYSPAAVEDGMGRYRWAHSLRGRGRNAVGQADQPIVDVDNQRQCTHSCFGGQYYGVSYNDMENDPAVLLTVPIRGPGAGSSKVTMVRVGESPPEWGERLLLNAGVIGQMRPASLPTLHAMARQRRGPPTVAASGVMDD